MVCGMQHRRLYTLSMRVPRLLLHASRMAAHSGVSRARSSRGSSGSYVQHVYIEGIPCTLCESAHDFLWVLFRHCEKRITTIAFRRTVRREHCDFVVSDFLLEDKKVSL